MMQRIAFGAALFAGAAQGFVVEGEATDPVNLFSARNEATGTFSAGFVAGPLMPVTADASIVTSTSAVEQLKWQIKNLSWIDEDTGYQYLEITNTLTMPILSTDELTFHLEFYEGDTAPTTELLRDGFECTMNKEGTSSYWEVFAEDLYVRIADGGDASTAMAATDFNNSVEAEGQDWFVFQTDRERDSRLCTTSGSGDYQCSKIKCILRRRMTTEDPDDFSFSPTTSTAAIMTFPAGKSYILLNQSEVTEQKRLRTLSDAQIQIKKGAYTTVASLLAAATTLVALTAF